MRAMSANDTSVRLRSFKSRIVVRIAFSAVAAIRNRRGCMPHLQIEQNLTIYKIRLTVAALVGLAPWTRRSRQRRGKSFIGGGRKSVRSSLFVGAMVAARYNPQLKSFRDKLVAAGKPKLIALVAVARKLITILNAILRDRRPWQPIPA